MELPELPQRKRMRLETWDYSSVGGYFLTFCIKNMDCLLGDVCVRDGVLDVPEVRLSYFGTIVRDQILEMERTYSNLMIDKFCVMPNHVHLLITLRNGTSGTPSRTNETIPAFVSTLKRFTNQKCGQKLWHRSYYDHIIRNEADYRRIWHYIDTNPQKWEDDPYYKG